MDKNFEPKVVARASQAAEGLCKWIRAMVLYDQVAKIVAPKKAKLATAERDYENTLTFLREKQQMLVKLNEKLDMLRENLQETMAKKIYLENEVGSFLLFFSFSFFPILSRFLFFSLLSFCFLFSFLFFICTSSFSISYFPYFHFFSFLLFLCFSSFSIFYFFLFNFFLFED